MKRATLFMAAALLLAGASGCLGGTREETLPTVSTPPPTLTEGRNRTLLASFTLNPLAPKVGDVVAFQDASKDPEFDLVSWAWDFGDGRSSNQRNPAHIYATAGIFSVVLRVKNEVGLEAQARRSVVVAAKAGGGDGSPTDPEFLGFGAPVTIQSSNGGEPSIAVDASGRIYVAPVGRLWRSTDKGRTFEELRPPGIFSGDSHVVVDKDERLWFSDLGGYVPQGAGSATVYSSTDQGDSWSGNPAATDAAVNDRQWLAAPGGGVAYLLYRQCVPVVLAGIASPGLYCALPQGRMTKTTDGGQTWLPLTRTFAWTAYPVVDPRDGTLHVVQAEQKRVSVQTSTDGGSTWREATIANRNTDTDLNFVSAAVDKGGNVYAAWIDRDTSQFDVWMSASKDRGATWGAPVRVSSGIGTAVFPWIAAGAAGKVVVVWYGTNVTGDPNTMASTTPWWVYAAHSSNATGSAVFRATRATDVVHQGPICLEGLNCQLPTGDGDRDLLDFLSVAITPDGLAAIAYAEDGATTTAKLRFVLQTDGPRAN